jgi:Putative adhesin
MMLTLAVGATALLAPIQQDTTVPVPQGTRLELDAHGGSIAVRTWNRNAIQVSTDYGSDRYQISIEVSGGVASIGRVSKRGRSHPDMETDYRLTVPAWMDLELSSIEGDITVEGSQGRVTASSVEGGVTVRGGREFISIHSVEGEVLVDGARGRVEVNAVDGGIMITDTEGEIFVEGVDGDITMERVTSSDVEANTVDGNISYRGRVLPKGRYRLGSHDGDVTLEVPELNAVVSISTFEGEFDSCGYPVTVTGTTRTGTKRRFRFTVGAGEGRVDLETFDGNVYLVKTGCQ